MAARESLYPSDWFSKAAKDLQRVEILLKAADVEGAGFHLQQGLEKYLKGFLLSKGWELERIHDLVKLLNQAVQYCSNLETFRSLCKQVTNYYLIDRYPFFDFSEPSCAEIRQALDKAKELVDKIKSIEAA